MRQAAHNGLRFFTSSKLVVGFMVLMAAVIFSSSAITSAAPDYFAVEKPSSISQCQGGTWVTQNHWQRGHGWFGWWWGWHRVRVQVWTPNWEKLGFDSYTQCANYVSTPQPVSQDQCRREWYRLGFASRNDCYRYLRLHPGSGYGGDSHGRNDDHGHGRR